MASCRTTPGRTGNAGQGKGTSFFVDIPLGLSEGPPHGWDENAPGHFTSMRVLVIDDRITCERTAALLRHMEAEAAFALSGGEGLAKVREAKERRDYGVVFVDWKMPGMDGMETVRHIREVVGEGAAVIVMSAHDWGEREAPARAAGADSFINKRILREDLTMPF